MTILVLSDVHANLEALEAVLADAGAVEAVWFLGDAVGYGPDPNAVVERLADLSPSYWLAGNHDWAALGKLDRSDFNTEARIAAEWTSQQLTKVVRQQLDAVEPRLDLADARCTLVHASPRHPIWEYILDAGTAAENFAEFDAPLGLFGHTHVPVIYEQTLDGTMRLPYTLETAHTPDDGRRLINPGSVGQPRDGDPRASYLLLEPTTGAVTFRRVAYDIAAVQEKILRAGLPGRLAARLDFGW
jgi:diadenosine tetraphosphatase ApaH/serine/threonine PP2A family protein phosphatase